MRKKEGGISGRKGGGNLERRRVLRGQKKGLVRTLGRKDRANSFGEKGGGRYKVKGNGRVLTSQLPNPRKIWFLRIILVSDGQAEEGKKKPLREKEGEDHARKRKRSGKRKWC